MAKVDSMLNDFLVERGLSEERISGLSQIEIKLYNSLMETHLRNENNDFILGEGWRNVLISGLSGSGKTAIVKAWCEENGINIVYKSSTSYNFYESIVDMGNVNCDKILLEEFGELEKPNSVLVLDDFQYFTNKAGKIVFPIMDNHSIVLNDGSEKKLDGFMFTVAIKTEMLR